VLPETDPDGTRQVALQLWECVNALQIPHAGSNVADHVAISVGVACQLVALGQQLPELIGRADAQLYAAKRRGCNQVVFSPGPLV
jgi:diguanylate cyclase (GGDEF)-like protein